MQNPAHLGDIVSPTIGELKGQHGEVIAHRLIDNRCMVRFASEGDDDDPRYEQYPGHRLTLIECVHLGVTTVEQESDT